MDDTPQKTTDANFLYVAIGHLTDSSDLKNIIFQVLKKASLITVIGIIHTMITVYARKKTIKYTNINILLC